MAFFNEFPHTRTFDSDLAWLIKRMKEVLSRMDSVEARMQALEDLVNDFINTLDIPEEIARQLQKMVEDGTFLEILRPLIAGSMQYANVVLGSFGNIIKRQAGIQDDIVILGNGNVEIESPPNTNLMIVNGFVYIGIPFTDGSNGQLAGSFFQVKNKGAYTATLVQNLYIDFDEVDTHLEQYGLEVARVETAGRAFVPGWMCTSISNPATVRFTSIDMANGSFKFNASIATNGTSSLNLFDLKVPLRPKTVTTP